MSCQGLQAQQPLTLHGEIPGIAFVLPASVRACHDALAAVAPGAGICWAKQATYKLANRSSNKSSPRVELCPNCSTLNCRTYMLVVELGFFSLMDHEAQNADDCGVES